MSAAPPRDIEAIRDVLSRATGTGWEAAYRHDIGALLDEVERLRQLQPKRDYYASLGAAQERAAVVAWLRGLGWACGDDAVTVLVGQIERGEHRREREPVEDDSIEYRDIGKED